MFTFDEKLYFNYAQSLSDSDITIGELELAAKPLCDEIGNATEQVTHYYGAWVKTRSNTYKDMFVGCCKLCQVLSKVSWLITLKIQMAKLTQFGLQRNDVLMYHKRKVSVIDTSYLTVTGHNIPACESSTYNLIPVLLGNRVGFAGAYNRLSWQSLLLRATAPPRKTENVYTGRVCVIYVLLTKHYGYECCCYGDKIPHCQEQVRNGITTGSSLGVFRGKKIACIIDEDSVGYLSSVHHSAEGIEFRGDVYELMSRMEQYFCELHVKFNSTKQMNVLFNGYFTTSQLALSYQQASRAVEQLTSSDINKSQSKQQLVSTPPSLIDVSDVTEEMDYYKQLIEKSANITQRFQCINVSSWDARAHDLVQFNCAQLLPLDAQCPFNASRALEHQHIMCCCGHRSFCNYNVDIVKRAAAKTIPNLCQYNNVYQYFVHDYFYPTEPDVDHSCLLHFISGNALRDMSHLFPSEDSIIFFLPGSAIQPIDFSYALLKPNECDYLDLRKDYLRTRYCYESSTLLKYFETEFMPMRLFACRCETAPGQPPCDNILKENIAEKAKHSNRKYYCASYSNRYSLEFKQNPEFELNDLSPYCTTVLDFKEIGDKFYYTFRGNTMHRSFVNKVKFQLAMIPFTMYTLTGETTQLCKHLKESETILCICRNSYTNRKPCNLNSSERGKALQLAIRETNLFKTRKLAPNRLAAYATWTKSKWCHTESVFSTIIVDNKQGKTEIISECGKKMPKFSEEESEYLLCAEKLLYDECGVMSTSRGEAIVCCCDDNCDSIGSQLHELALTYSFQ
ncbi:unnamed protein product [Litomosoides sigmodontis]|uniref:Uncharacterized protein n=1 Tax=Litomosoides sigmodontis TaxID=42156 RepID=A0A3P6S298_LITSI|nr:unnamed protein product [Litomosoides sigmodontis]